MFPVVTKWVIPKNPPEAAKQNIQNIISYITLKLIKYLRPEYTNVFFAADVDCVLKTSPQNPAGIAPDIMIAPSHVLASLKFYRKWLKDI